MDIPIAKTTESWREDSGSAGWAEPASVLPVLDPDAIAGIRELQGEGGDDLLGELIDIFVRDVPARLSDLQRALQAGDAVALRAVAHAVKGSSGSLGAQHLAAICGDLEQCGRTGGLEGAGELLAAAAREFERVRVALEAERTR